MTLTPVDFFDLTSFEHSALFEGVHFVWEVLQKIALYLGRHTTWQQRGRVEKGAFLINPETIFLGKESVVEAGAYIKGPCILGNGCEVRSGAYIRGNFIAGNHCIIGHATEVKNALFLDGAKAGHFAYVGDSILGNRVNLGAGVKCANFRLDEKTIFVRAAGKKVDTGLRKLGAIMGDDVHIGCNSVTNPGTLIGKKSQIYPCLAIHGLIAEQTVVKK